MNITPGDRVRQLAPIVEGEVKDVRWNKADKRFDVLVEYVGGGERHERWFDSKELEVIPPEGNGEEEAKQ